MSNKPRKCEFCGVKSTCPCETEKNSKTCILKKIKTNGKQKLKSKTTS